MGRFDIIRMQLGDKIKPYNKKNGLQKDVDSRKKLELIQEYLKNVTIDYGNLLNKKVTLEQSVQIAQLIHSNSKRSDALKIIIDAYLKLGDVDQAYEISEKFNHMNNSSLLDIMKEYLIKDKVEQALKVYEIIQDTDYQSSALCYLAEKDIEMGNNDNAKIKLQKALKNTIGIQDEDLRSAYLCEIVKIQTKYDDIEEILKIVNGISVEYRQSIALYYVVEALVKSGDFENAKINAEKITDKKWRTDAHYIIAQMQVDSGDMNKAFDFINKTKVKLFPEIQLEESSIQFESESDFEKEKPYAIKSKKTKDIAFTRGFEIIGNTFVYKVKVLNHTPHRINDIKIQVLSDPNDCLKADTTERTVPKIEPNGGFRSLEFKFTPTHDCVQGVVNSLVTYIDSTETLQTQVVEPIVIKSVCDLLKPLEGSKYEILDIIEKLKAGAQDEVTIPDSASEMFQRFLDVLPDRNFAITDSDSKEVGGRFMGNITAAARGKYTNENIGLKITVLDNGDGGCTVHFKACGNDQSMLPTAVEEVKQILDTKALLVMNIMRTLNVIREAPDDPNIEGTVHDRRHIFNPVISAGGIVQIEARVNDPFSPQKRAFAWIAWPTPVDGIEEEEVIEEEVFIDCPPCTGSGLKPQSRGGFMIDGEDLNGNCEYSSGRIHDFNIVGKGLVFDRRSIEITTHTSNAEKIFLNAHSKVLSSLQKQGTSVKKDIEGEELSVVFEEMLYTEDDIRKPDPVPSVRNVVVNGIFLYREKYYIEVAVSTFDYPKNDVINSFDELVKCAKAVIDEKEGVSY